MNGSFVDGAKRKRLMAIDSEGSHGTSGTPHTRGFLACGTPSHMELDTTKLIQLSLEPQYTAVAIEDPTIRTRQIMSFFRSDGVVSPLT
ncbi:hypothetical protein SDJN03_00901, partial [Cucurbita argyrosperma subsp. sororia]